MTSSEAVVFLLAIGKHDFWLVGIHSKHFWTCAHKWFGNNMKSIGFHAAAAAKSLSVMSDSMRPYRRQPTRLPRPWDSPGKNPGVGCHFLLSQGAFLSADYGLSFVSLVSSFYSDYDPYPVKYVENSNRHIKGCHRRKSIKICEKTCILRRSGKCAVSAELRWRSRSTLRGSLGALTLQAASLQSLVNPATSLSFLL